MQAYHAHYERGQIVPIDNPMIPEGSQIIVTVLDSSVPDLENENHVRKQREAIDRFLEEMRTCDEPLSSEFDAIVSRRLNLKLSHEANL